MIQRVESQLPSIVRSLTQEIGEHIDQLVDVKLMVIKRFDPELANRVFLEMGGRELRFIKNFGFVFGFVARDPGGGAHAFRQLLVAFADPRGGDRLRDELGGAVDDLRACRSGSESGRCAGKGLFIRRQPEVADVYATIVADEILTVAEFGKELLKGQQSDRTRALIRSALEPAIDSALGELQPAVRVAVGHREYEEIRHAFATEPIESLMEPLTDPQFAKTQSATMRKLIAERMREMDPADFGEMLRTATREDEWLLLAHGAVLGLAGGLVHLAIFG